MQETPFSLNNYVHAEAVQWIGQSGPHLQSSPSLHLTSDCMHFIFHHCCRDGEWNGMKLQRSEIFKQMVGRKPSISTLILLLQNVTPAQHWLSWFVINLQRSFDCCEIKKIRAHSEDFKYYSHWCEALNIKSFFFLPFVKVIVTAAQIAIAPGLETEANSICILPCENVPAANLYLLDQDQSKPLITAHSACALLYLESSRETQSAFSLLKFVALVYFYLCILIQFHIK